MKGAFEYDHDKIIAIVKDSEYIHFIDRKMKKEAKIKNHSDDKNFKSLRPFPNFNLKTFPYVLLKD